MGGGGKRKKGLERKQGAISAGRPRSAAHKVAVQKLICSKGGRDKGMRALRLQAPDKKRSNSDVVRS